MTSPIRNAAKAPPERPYIIAKAGAARRDLLAKINMELSDVRIVRNSNSLFGAYNGTLYVGHGADRKLVSVARDRGFTIVEID